VVIDTDPLHRPAIGQRPGQWRPAVLGQLRIADIQRQLDPLVMRQLQHERRVVRLGAIALLQPGDELLTDLEEVRRARPMLGEERAQQPLPALGPENPAQHRKGAAHQAGDVVEEQLLVDRHALGRDARQQGLRLRLANTCSEVALLLNAAHVPYLLSGCTACCRLRICASSAYSSASGGKLKSRSSSVGRTPCCA